MLLPQVNAFLHDHLRPFLNFHRPCLFPTEVIRPNGRIRGAYRQDDVATPYQHLRSLPDAQRFLKPEITFETLDHHAAATTHLAAAQAALFRARAALFRAIGQARSSAA